MQSNDISLSSQAQLDLSNPEDLQIDSASVVSSETQDKPTSFTFKSSNDFQQIVFVKLRDISKQNLEAGFVDQALGGFERCSEQLVEILKGDTESPTFHNFLYETLTYLNDVALKLLRVNGVDNALKILNKCLEIAHPEPYRVHPDLQSLTYNHLGCCYRRMGDLEQALYCLQKALHYQERALEMNIQGRQMDSLSVTHLNMCAVLSQKGK